ncbi:hypothetical protein BJX66DRAFT_107228 [Aspergillus keveii]|uniref:Uncharacterized protein n=1 Tax=Aspergillus keveii TaxID=714993 RepID=A0ABR4GDT6_9EURO
MFADIARDGLAHELVVLLVQSLHARAGPRVGDVWGVRIYTLSIVFIPATDIQDGLHCNVTFSKPEMSLVMDRLLRLASPSLCEIGNEWGLGEARYTPWPSNGACEPCAES